MRYTRGAMVLVAIAMASCGADEARGTTAESLPVPSAVPVSSMSIAAAVTVPSMTTESTPATADTAGGEAAADGPRFTVDLDGVVPASVPIVLAEHLGSVVQAVRAEVGDAVFGGSAVQNGDRPDVTMTIYGTDLDAIATALSRIDTAYRDRFTVVETIYSVSDIETFAAEAHRRLDDAGIAASVLVQFGLDAVPVHLETRDGEPDDRLEADVLNLLEDIPVVISFHGPMVLYDQLPAPVPTG